MIILHCILVTLKWKEHVQQFLLTLVMDFILIPRIKTVFLRVLRKKAMTVSFLDKIGNFIHLSLKVTNFPKFCFFFKFEPANVCLKTTMQPSDLILLKVIK